MGEEAAKKNFLASLKNQSCLEKSTQLKSFTFMAPSSFQGADHADGSNNPELNLNLSISNNHNFDQAEKDLINGTFPTPISGGNFNKNQTDDEGQASNPDLDLKLASEILLEGDPEKLKRIMANRNYSKKYRLKKMHYINNMEKLTEALIAKIANMHLQIEENKNMQRSLLLEQHQLKLQIAAYEKDRIVKEAENEKNIAEANRLRELQINQLKSKNHPMPTSNASLHEVNPQLDLDLDLNLQLGTNV